MQYYAHSSEDPNKAWQTLLDHLEGTSKISGEFAAKFNSKKLGEICGMLHDLGKYSCDFQKKIRGNTLYVDHSTAGAKEAINLFGNSLGRIFAYCIAGHHSGLPDFGSEVSTEGTLWSRLNKEIKDYSAYKKELNVSSLLDCPNPPIKIIDNKIGFTLAFYIRMLYSCLVDADFLDTEKYMLNEKISRGNYMSFFELRENFYKYLSNRVFKKSIINDKRNNILERCKEMAKLPLGLYTLTVPTGGGKTLSSLAFALNHAIKYDLQRIIYVIPYTSIIEQNAKVFKNVLGEEYVLEHHSNYQFDDSISEEHQSLQSKLKLAAENWDIPIIVTTNVQFFESLFSNKSSRCRKLHNIAKSVIIFDEAQMLPISYLKPCLLAISELVINYGSTALLCTATQPSINELLPQIIKPIEIAENPRQLYLDFKKVKVVNIGELDDDTLADNLNKYCQVLCIVNTRKHAKEIFNKLDGASFHLSTLMCPIHRQETLKIIRQRLKDEKQCRVVSTQLIEAGVDIDFPVVFRSMAGIDSIVQSAGRCNREGNLPFGTTYVFRPVSDFAKIRGYLDRTARVAEMVFRKFEDPISLEAIDYYFKMLYDFEGEEALDSKDIIGCFEERGKLLEFDFQTAAEKFKLIESNTYSVIVPFDEKAQDLIEQVKFNPYPRNLARKLQPYTVSVYDNELKSLFENNALKEINGFIILNDYKNFYSLSTGLIIPKEIYGEAIFV